ncbi:hypothetical protein GCM10010495_75360 [Kitasatospora herbaricolor]|uniref:hypothetical protein n=1 Tax=Kitasatospora herbaricolor TaxID=68217 RepID=UPI001748B52B|nr:hypothetical protein [Kitasatospora herbaricolor]MDQ0306691.1 hypothetical protein [Kitasatospora herbaricolor]GGV46683.1 hypothetical protein GCM10010495_75360 [Kitasatospora herbaricolor]
MSEHATPDTATRSTGCCGPVATERPAVQVTAAAAPCCGTAEHAGSEACCDPAARREAVAAGAGCC